MSLPYLNDSRHLPKWAANVTTLGGGVGGVGGVVVVIVIAVPADLIIAIPLVPSCCCFRYSYPWIPWLGQDSSYPLLAA